MSCFETLHSSLNMLKRMLCGPTGTECHHIVVEDWDKMEEPGGTLFVSMPSLLDKSLCPEGTQLVHIFTPDWIHNWQARLHLSDTIMSPLCDMEPQEAGIQEVKQASFNISLNSQLETIFIVQGLDPNEYDRRKEEVADQLVQRLEAFLPGLQEATVYREVHFHSSEATYHLLKAEWQLHSLQHIFKLVE